MPKSTSLLIEIFIGGFLGLLWISFIVFKEYNISFDILLKLISNNSISLYITMVVISLSYVIGWSINSISYILSIPVIILIKKNIFKNNYKIYKSIKELVFSQNNIALNNLNNYHNLIRFSRTNIINFTIFSVLAYKLNFQYIFYALLIIVIVNFGQLIYLNYKYYTSIYSSYKIIKRKR